MSTEQKSEKRKKGGTTPAPAKPNGKPKIKKDNVPEKVPIAQSPSSKCHNHESNGAKSKSKGEQKVKASGDGEAVDHCAQASNGIDGSKKKKQVKEEKKRKLKEAIDDSLLYQIPMSRVSRIIKSEDPNVRITQEAVYIINKASEKFLQVFAAEAYAGAYLDRKKHIDYKHLSSAVSKQRRFDFLSDFVPEKVKAEDAIVESEAVEN